MLNINKRNIKANQESNMYLFSILFNYLWNVTK